MPRWRITANLAADVSDGSTSVIAVMSAARPLFHPKRKSFAILLGRRCARSRHHGHFHSIIVLARERNVSARVRPRALAVLRLITRTGGRYVFEPPAGRPPLHVTRSAGRARSREGVCGSLREERWTSLYQPAETLTHARMLLVRSKTRISHWTAGRFCNSRLGGGVGMTSERAPGHVLN